MPPPRRRPAVERATAHLSALLAERRPEYADRLPGIRALAAAAGVSHVTMWKAVQSLKRSGVVQTAPERKIFAGPVPPPPQTPSPAPEPPPVRPRWLELRDAIASDLLAARFPPGVRLPPVKELCGRLGAGRASVARALRALLAEGRLQRDGRRLRAAIAVARGRSARLVFVAEQPGGDALGDAAPRALELWRGLEDACGRRRLRLEARSAVDCVARLRRGPESGVVGYVVRSFDLEIVARVLAALAPTGLPVGLVDEVGLASRLVWPQRSTRFRTFAIAHSERAGREVADALLALGHRRIGFFSAYGGADWSARREAGVRHVFRAAGRVAAVEGFVVPRFPDDVAQREDLLGRTAYRAFARRGGALLEALDPGSRPGVAPALFLPPLLAAQVAGALRPLFERASRDRSLTAWVGANDLVALAALRFLESRGRRVPHDVAVVGFDDSLEALRAGLASYDFNLPALASALVEHVVSWRTRAGRDRGAVIEIPGALVDRASLGAPPARR
ncbi:MAG: substrate-binding domain-containing protein [Vicinamibacteria bacterium]